MKTNKYKKWEDAMEIVEDIIKELESEIRIYDGTRIHCVDVKRYDRVDLAPLLKEYDEKTQKRILEIYTDEHLSDLFENFLQFARNHFMKTRIDIKDESFGFYGRSGGWFGYDCTDLLSEGQHINYEYCYITHFCDMNNDLTDKELDEDINTAYDFIDKYNRYKRVLEQAKEYNSNLSFIPMLKNQFYWVASRKVDK